MVKIWELSRKEREGESLVLCVCEHKCEFIHETQHDVMISTEKGRGSFRSGQ